MKMKSILRFFRSDEAAGWRAAADRARDAGQWREAARLYSAYLEAHPADFGLWIQCGHAEKESGRLDRALSCYSMAMSLNERDADLHLQLGHLHKLMGRLDAAAQAYRQSVAIAGDGSPAARELGELSPYAREEPQVVAGGAGDVGEEASDHAGEYVDIPAETLSDRAGLLDLLDLERTQGNASRAAAICRAIVRLSPLEAEGWTMLAEALAGIEDFDQAIRCRRIADRLGAEAAPPVREETADIGVDSPAASVRP
jgi:tetratricopeptide (TPR) repeat protein